MQIINNFYAMMQKLSTKYYYNNRYLHAKELLIDANEFIQPREDKMGSG